MRSLHFSHALFIIRGFSLLLFCLATFGLLAQGSDSLIDVDSLEKLNAIRYDLNGSGVADSVDDQSAYEAAFGTLTGTYTGYELTASLDFKNGSEDPAEYSMWAEGSAHPAAVAEGWEPIGVHGKYDGGFIDSSDTTFKVYVGDFIGNDHTISNLYINRPGAAYIGLFGGLGVEANVHRLSMLDINVMGLNHVGGLVGANWGTIVSCHTTGVARGGLGIGGLVGTNYAKHEGEHQDEFFLLSCDRRY